METESYEIIGSYSSNEKRMKILGVTVLSDAALRKNQQVSPTGEGQVIL